MGDCDCAPSSGSDGPAQGVPTGCTPCMIPTIPVGTPVTQVNPCPPLPMASCNPCCNVQVPVVGMLDPPQIIVRKRCRYIQPDRPKSFRPNRVYQPPTSKMEDNTIYRKSYLPVDGEMPAPVYPSNNICLGEGKISDNTVHRMSYKGHLNTRPPCAILPCEHNLLGEGPMQDITTQKHDYVPKPYSKAGSIAPTPNIFSSDCPLSDQTTNRLSYMPIDVKSVHVDPVRPTNAIIPATGKFAQCTIHKMSYLPWEAQEKMDMPWAKKPGFAPPTTRMEGCTVQKMSYGPPGTYIECNDDCPDCVECPQLDCHTHQFNSHQPENCCAPCCCPKAAC